MRLPGFRPSIAVDQNLTNHSLLRPWGRPPKFTYLRVPTPGLTPALPKLQAGHPTYI
jgi:hypothetical protein